MTASPSSNRIYGSLVLAALVVGASVSAAEAQVDLEQAPPPGAAKPQGVPEPKAAPRAGTPPAADKNAPPVETGPEQHAKLLDELYTRLATAPDQATASEIAAAIEQLW